MGFPNIYVLKWRREEMNTNRQFPWSRPFIGFLKELTFLTSTLFSCVDALINVRHICCEIPLGTSLKHAKFILNDCIYGLRWKRFVTSPTYFRIFLFEFPIRGHILLSITRIQLSMFNHDELINYANTKTTLSFLNHSNWFLFWNKNKKKKKISQEMIM